MKQLILALLLFIASPMYAAIAHDADSHTDGGTSATFNWSHTCTGSNLVLMVFVGIIDTGLHPTVSGITYNGVALTHVVASNNYGTSSNYADYWYIKNPTTGANSIAVTLSSAPNIQVFGGGISLTGVDQTNPIDAFNTSNSAGGNCPGACPSVTVTTVANNAFIVDGVIDNGPDQANYTKGASQTVSWNFNNAGVTRSAQGSYTTAAVTPAGATAMTWTGSTGSAWAQVGVSLKPASAGGGNTMPPAVY